MDNKNYGRRDFLKFLGLSVYSTNFIASQSLAFSNKPKSLFPSSVDQLTLHPQLKSSVLIKWEDKISAKDTFGFNNDYNAFIPLSKDRGILWTNHEYINPIFLHGSRPEKSEKTKEQVELEMYNVGGSLVELKKNEDKTWSVVQNSKYNRRVTGLTDIPFAANVQVKGAKSAMGTLANCAGGVTPWGTVLTCEENYDSFYGDRDSKNKKIKSSRYFWDKYFQNPPEHYGWVVEVDPRTGKSKKHSSLGRYMHEAAAVTTDKNKTVCYSGDDKANEFIYKFISDKKDSLDKGTLHVANVEEGKWLPLDLEQSPVLKKHFKTQIDVLTYCREAGRILGATPMNRPEDIEIHPKTNEVFICLSNNAKKLDFHGSILKISEDKNDPLKFKSETFLMGGKTLSCPDNIVFDSRGNLYVATDISGKRIGKYPYTDFENNGLFVVPAEGANAGQVIQIASAPNDAEFTGVYFSEDEETLFMSVQHPGELSKSASSPTSHWPSGSKSEIPRPAVVQLQGKAFQNVDLF